MSNPCNKITQFIPQLTLADLNKLKYNQEDFRQNSNQIKNKNQSMKFIITILLIALLSVAACLYLPWWSIAIVAFVVAALIPQSPGKSFLSGFIALFLLWGILSFSLSAGNDHILAHRFSQLILKADSPVGLILVTALIGALVAGFAALSGSFIRKRKVSV